MLNSKIVIMKKLNLDQMENLQGGKFHYTWRQHVGCFLVGAVVGGGIGSVVAYGACLLLEY